MNWLLLALFAPFIYSITNIFDKYLVDNKIKHPIVVLPLYGLLGFLSSVLIISFNGYKAVPLFDLLLLTSAGIFFILYTYPYYKAMQIEEASRVVPLFQLIPIFSLVLSYLFLNELLTNNQLLGFVLIFFGAIALSLEKSAGSFISLKKPFWLMTISSFLYAVAGVIAKVSSIYSDFWLSLTYISFGMGIGGILLLFSKDIRKKTIQSARVKSVLLIITAGNVLALIAQVSHIKAYDLAPIALVNVILGTQPFFIFVLTIFVSLLFPKVVKEDLSVKNLLSKVVPIILIFIGLYFVNI